MIVLDILVFIACLAGAFLAGYVLGVVDKVKNKKKKRDEEA